MQRYILAVLAVAVLVSASVAVVVVRLASSRDNQSFTPDPSTELFERLIVRLEQLEARLPEDEAGPARRSEQPGAVAGDSFDDDQRFSALSERLARLEEMERNRQESACRRAEQRQQIEEQPRQQFAQATTAAAEIMLDPVANESVKVRAWQQLRMSAASVWTDAIVAEAARIGTTSPDPQVRADVWRQAHANHTHPFLLQPLIQAVTSDPDRTVREEAAETLDLYLSEPGVRGTLQAVSQSDVDAGVRQ